MKKFRLRLLIALFITILLLFSGAGIIIGATIDRSDPLIHEWATIFASLVAAALLFAYIGYVIICHWTRPFEDAFKMAEELSEGNFRQRVYEYDPETGGRMNQSLNTLARNLEKMMSSYEIQQDRLGTLIENIGSGLIFMDDKGYIQLVNRTYKETFQPRTDDWFEKRFDKALPYREMIEIVRETFMIEATVRKQLLIPLRIERRHFDVYSAPIIASNQKLKGIVVVFHDITELKRLEQMRKDFVANVSHELKTPVTSLKGFAETLIDGAMEDKQLRERFLSIIWKESERLQSLIRDLLDLSKIEEDHFQLEWQDVHLPQLLEDIVFMLEGNAKAKQIDLVFKVSGNSVIEGDPYRLRQIFINIINNAIAYSPEGSRVTVNVVENNDTVTFSSEDTGIGIDQDEIPRIFERFYRINKDRSRHSGGTGLGLAIVKHLVESHHGQIKVYSEKGVGTKFEIIFHKRRPDSPSDS
jgi:two-component system phosphate regulon sensor histidine kinase PhoR